MEIRLREKEIYHQTVLAKDVSSSDTPIYTTLLIFERRTFSQASFSF